jgi:hypothetical protein
VRWQAKRDTALDSASYKAIQSAAAAALCRRTPHKVAADETLRDWLITASHRQKETIKNDSQKVFERINQSR